MMKEVLQKFSEGRSSYQMEVADLSMRRADKTLFTDWIVQEPKPKDFVIPTLPAFNGRGDPLDHIFQFQQKMSLVLNNEAIHCKVFSTTFTVPSLLWFRQLQPCFINSFNDFRRQFLQQYRANREAPKTMGDLYHIEQGENEHPQAYLQRFMDLVHQIHNVDTVIAANLFIKNLQVGTLLYENLTLTPLYDLADIKIRAEGGFHVLEARDHTQKKLALILVLVVNNPPLPTTKDKRKSTNFNQEKGSKRSKNRGERYVTRISISIPLEKRSVKRTKTAKFGEPIQDVVSNRPKRQEHILHISQRSWPYNI
ncbi:uncharacterized protein LOC133791606 [Humulus lupulus]|uniref:uncharacterized protein LOC133791606 n=1 Tax=Humulus lupulus TaxID=3486 RepID=UPI002B41047B|nr:uncharacterized protein LOC133791606 [Humulus lupulus]